MQVILLLICRRPTYISGPLAITLQTAITKWVEYMQNGNIRVSCATLAHWNKKKHFVMLQKKIQGLGAGLRQQQTGHKNRHGDDARWKFQTACAKGRFGHSSIPFVLDAQ